MYIVSRSISQGRMAGIYSALGISAGIVVHTLLAAIGLSITLVQSEFLFNLVKIIGDNLFSLFRHQNDSGKKQEKNQKSFPKELNDFIVFIAMGIQLLRTKAAANRKEHLNYKMLFSMDVSLN